MKIRIIKSGALALLAGLFVLLPSCVAPVPSTVTLTAPAVTATLPVTQTLTATAVVTATVATTLTATTTAPPVTTTATATLTQTIIPPPVTATQLWPPSTSDQGAEVYFYLPPINQGQKVTFTLTYTGLPATYVVRDPANNVILSGKIESPAKSGTASFTAPITGNYQIECIPTDGPVDVFTLSYILS